MITQLWNRLCGDTHVCLYNTRDVISVTHVFCYTILVCNVSFTHHQPPAADNQ